METVEDKLRCGFKILRPGTRQRNLLMIEKKYHVVCLIFLVMKSQKVNSVYLHYEFPVGETSDHSFK